LRIELLHLEDCPGSAEALSILEEALTETRISAEIEPVAIDPDSQFNPPESPTILVYGEDLFPVEKLPGVRAASCRIYATSKGPKNYPTTAMVREALRDVSLKSSQPTRGPENALVSRASTEDSMG
jgi:hypothetical protein